MRRGKAARLENSHINIFCKNRLPGGGGFNGIIRIETVRVSRLRFSVVTKY